MRLCYDSVTPSAIPTNAALVAGYVDGAYAWSAADWARFPHSVKVRIAVFPSTNDGHVLDVEQGDATPAQAPGWVVRRRTAGVDPTIYCNASTWPAVKAAFAAAGVPEPHYWIAQYDGVPTIPAGAVAKQYQDPPASGGDYDLSAVADYWPGIDTVEGPMKQIMLGQRPGNPEIWAGDGTWRRRVPDVPTLNDMQYMISQAGGDTTVHEIGDLWVLGEPVPDVLGAIGAVDADVKATDADVKTSTGSILAAVAAGVQVTLTAEQAAAIEAQLAKALPGYVVNITPAPAGN